MLRLGGIRRCGRPSRRQALQAGGAAALGLGLADLLRADESPAAIAPTADACIVLFLSGGPSQYETFDPKPDAPVDVRGDTKPIGTNVAGILLSDQFPELAKQADKFTLVRSTMHAVTSHPAAMYGMITGSPYPRAPQLANNLSREDRPHYGSVLASARPPRQPVPPFVMVPEQISPIGTARAGQHAGFLGSAFDPLVVVGDPNLPGYGAPAVNLPDGVPLHRLGGRKSLLDALNRRVGHLSESSAGRDFDPFQRKALELVTSPATRRAFELDGEPDAVRDRYGRHYFGQGALLARRLVEAGTRLVAVNWVRHDKGPGGQGWDTHRDHLSWCREELLPPTDRAVAALLSDLSSRGLLKRTLVVVMGEFGRTPKFNTAAGRDHWPHVYSTLIAGGGVKAGFVHGASDRLGMYPTRDPVTPADLAATIYRCLGIDPTGEVRDRLNRPFPLTDGAPVEAILA